MSYTIDAAGPSDAPELLRILGSNPMISAVFRNVIVPPGWMSWAGVVFCDGASVTMPPVGWRDVCAPDGFLVVAVVFFTVPLVVLAVVDVPDADAAVVLVVWSPPSVTVVGVVASVDDVVACVSAVLFLLPPPPHAAATNPTTATTPNHRRALIV